MIGQLYLVLARCCQGGGHREANFKGQPNKNGCLRRLVHTAREIFANNRTEKVAASNLRSVVSEDSEHVVKVFSNLANGHFVHRVVESWNKK